MDLRPLMDKYGDAGLFIIQLLGENDHREPPAQEVLEAWASVFKLETPVLADPEWEYTRKLWAGGRGVDHYALVDRGAILHQRTKPTEADIEALLTGR